MRGLSRLLALVLALGLGACRSGAGAQGPSPKSGAFGKVAGKPDARQWMRLPAQGNAQVLAVEAGVAGDRISALLEVPETDCAVLISRGTTSVDDVDLFA